jgi:AcrR family transcriptional regulator
MKTGKTTAGDTKARILDATEKLFIEVGYEATSLRQVTSRAIVNLAAVNYHFRSKEIMMQSVLGAGWIRSMSAGWPARCMRGALAG